MTESACRMCKEAVPQGIRAHGGMNGAVRHKATPRLNLHCHLSVEEMFETECGHTPT